LEHISKTKKTVMKHEFRVGSSDVKLELTATSSLEDKLFSDLLVGNGLEVVRNGASIVIQKKQTKSIENEETTSDFVDSGSNNTENSRTPYT
jgi:hypothetical protein